MTIYSLLMMKKILTFVVAAIGMAALTACVGGDGNSEGNAVSQDSTTNVAPDQPKEASSLIEKDRFTFTLPEGWEDTNADKETSAKCRKPNKDDKSASTYAVSMYANTASSMQTAEKAVAHMTENGLKAGDDMVVGDKTFKVVKHNSDPNHCWLFTDLPQGDGVLHVEVLIGNASDPEVQQLLESVKFK